MNEPAAPSSFTGHYQFTAADYAALVDVMRRGRWGMRTILGVLWLSVVVLIIGLSSKNWTQFTQAMHDLVTLHDVPPFIYGVISGVLVMIVFLPQIIKWRAMRAYPSFAIAGREIDITLDETGFASASKGRHGQMDWAEVRQVFITPEFLILAISKREGISVPKRAFANEMEFAAVTAWIRRKVPTVRPK